MNNFNFRNGFNLWSPIQPASFVDSMSYLQHIEILKNKINQVIEELNGANFYSRGLKPGKDINIVGATKGKGFFDGEASTVINTVINNSVLTDNTPGWHRIFTTKDITEDLKSGLTFLYQEQPLNQNCENDKLAWGLLKLNFVYKPTDADLDLNTYNIKLIDFAFEEERNVDVKRFMLVRRINPCNNDKNTLELYYKVPTKEEATECSGACGPAAVFTLLNIDNSSIDFDSYIKLENGGLNTKTYDGLTGIIDYPVINYDYEDITLTGDVEGEGLMNTKNVIVETTFNEERLKEEIEKYAPKSDVIPPDGFTEVYLDVVNGDDENDGLSEETPMKTMTALLNKNYSKELKIYLLGTPSTQGEGIITLNGSNYSKIELVDVGSTLVGYSLEAINANLTINNLGTATMDFIDEYLIEEDTVLPDGNIHINVYDSNFQMFALNPDEDDNIESTTQAYYSVLPDDLTPNTIYSLDCNNCNVDILGSFTDILNSSFEKTTFNNNIENLNLSNCNTENSKINSSTKISFNLIEANNTSFTAIEDIKGNYTAIFNYTKNNIFYNCNFYCAFSFQIGTSKMYGVTGNVNYGGSGGFLEIHNSEINFVNWYTYNTSKLLAYNSKLQIINNNNYVYPYDTVNYETLFSTIYRTWINQIYYTNKNNKSVLKPNDTLGGMVRPDGTTITIDNYGVISAVGGGSADVSVDNKTIIKNEDNELQVNYNPEIMDTSNSVGDFVGLTVKPGNDDTMGVVRGSTGMSQQLTPNNNNKNYNLIGTTFENDTLNGQLFVPAKRYMSIGDEGDGAWGLGLNLKKAVNYSEANPIYEGFDITENLDAAGYKKYFKLKTDNNTIAFNNNGELQANIDTSSITVDTHLIPENTNTIEYYVDYIIGNETNDGLSLQTPKRTIEQVLNLHASKNIVINVDASGENVSVPNILIDGFGYESIGIKNRDVYNVNTFVIKNCNIEIDDTLNNFLIDELLVYDSNVKLHSTNNDVITSLVLNNAVFRFMDPSITYRLASLDSYNSSFIINKDSSQVNISTYFRFINSVWDGSILGGVITPTELLKCIGSSFRTNSPSSDTFNLYFYNEEDEEAKGYITDCSFSDGFTANNIIFSNCFIGARDEDDKINTINQGVEISITNCILTNCILNPHLFSIVDSTFRGCDIRGSLIQGSGVSNSKAVCCDMIISYVGPGVDFTGLELRNSTVFHVDTLAFSTDSQENLINGVFTE